MQLKICGVLEADEFLRNKNHGIDAAISILDPLCNIYIRPDGLDSVAHVLEIQFHDVEEVSEEYAFPTMEDAQSIVDFIVSTKSKPNSDSWLIHCHQGISRSTACGLLLCALTYGIDSARDHLLLAAPRAAPNTMLCEYFDQILDFNGKLSKLAWDFDFQLLKKMARRFNDTEGGGL